MLRLLVSLKMVLSCYIMVTQVTGIQYTFNTHRWHCLNVTFATNTSLWMNLWSFTVLRFIVDNKKHFKGCDDEKFVIRPGEASSGSVLTSPAMAVST